MSEIKKAGLGNKKTLEIGCGRGFVFRFLRENNIDCIGCELAEIEPLPEVKEHLNNGIDAIKIDKKVRDTIQCILLFDVIEHIEKPIQFLNNILEYYPNVENIVITVPARQELWTNFDENYRHFKRYKKDDFTEIANTLEFCIKRVNYFFVSLYFVILFFAKNRKNRKLKTNVPKGLSKYVNIFIGILFILDFKLLHSFNFGTSLIGILNKKR